MSPVRNMISNGMSEWFWVRFWISGFVVLALYGIFLAPPALYPVGSVMDVPEGASIAGVATLLQSGHAVAWPRLFSILVRIQGKPILAGPYLLGNKQNVLTLAYRFAHHYTDLAPIKITIPEGTSVRQAAAIIQKTLGDFDAQKFIVLAKPDEGYLFPDTYFFLPGVAPETVIAAMKANFQTRTEPLQKDIQAYGASESDVIIMASILEKEARQSETRRIVAGILWKRIGLGMPLQVDAVFGYIFNKDTYSPSASDLQVDSPYNTYKYRGLPPGPIGNPGVETIQDAVTPIKTPYLYYVTDKEGNIYYAKTFAEHLLNKAKARR